MADDDEGKKVEVKSSSIFRIPRFRVDVIALIVVNVAITIYMWKILPPLSDISGTYAQWFAVTAPFVFFMAGLTYGIWTKRFPFWEMIFTILISLKVIIDGCYREHLVIGLIITLLGYYFIEVFGVFIGQKYLEKHSNKYKGKTIYKRRTYPNKFVENTEIAIVVIIMNVWFVGGILAQFTFILDHLLITYFISYYFMGCLAFFLIKRMPYFIMAATIIYTCFFEILSLMTGDRLLLYVIGKFLQYATFYLLSIAGAITCKYIFLTKNNFIEKRFIKDA